MTEGAFLQDLAMLMAVAGAVSLLFTKLKWPKVIGYILAGVLLSRHSWGGSFISDESSVQTIGQLGIVFLMFTMGLGLSLTKLKKVGNVVLPTAFLDTVVMIGLGFTLARTVLGWGVVPSLFLGAAICDSATTLLAKVIDEMRWSSRPFVKYVLGTSVCEDIICVGVIALITGVANGEGMNIGSIAKSLGGLGIFFIAVFFFGLVLIPRFLTSIARRGDDESLLLPLLGCCFFVTYAAYRLDYSLALGAFLVGVIGASSEVRGRLGALVEPLRNMFASVFFVSIGLLVNPAACWENLPIILLLTVLVVFGKFFNCTLGALLTGVELKTAVQMGFSLAQIGEFAYMVALLYVTATGDLDKPMYQVVVGVSLLTTIINPMMIRFSDKAGDFIEQKTPIRIKNILSGYRGFLSRYRRSASGAKRTLVRKQFVEIVLLGVLCFAVALGFGFLSNIDWSERSQFFDDHKKLFFALPLNLILIMFFALAFKVGKAMSNSVAEILVGAGEARWQLSVKTIIRHFVLTLVVASAFVEFAIINANFTPEELWAKWAMFGIFVAVAFFGWRFFVNAGHRVASNFTAALEVDERLAKLSRELTFTVPEDVIAKVTVPADSPVIGVSVGDLNIRAETGATVVTVIRGDVKIRNVGPKLSFLGGDILVAMGDEIEIAKLKALLGGGL